MDEETGSASKWRNAADLANMLKAFIGSSYLAVAFGFMQSGYLLGICGLVLVATLTDHCCQLLIKCKNEIVDQYVDDYSKMADSPPTDSELKIFKRKTENHLTYGDMGWIVGGNVGYATVNFCLVLTQYVVCTAYSIFIGNTIQALLLPVTAAAGPSNKPDIKPNLSSSSNGSEFHPFSLQHLTMTNLTDTNQDTTNSLSAETSRLALIFIPLPAFVAFSLFRNFRQLSVFSTLANLALLVGFITITVNLIRDFQLGEGISWLANWDTFPVFFGQVTIAFEGTGLIISMQSSMEGNRHLFEPFLHTVIATLTLMFAIIGSLGYLKYGSSTKQMINLNISSTSGTVGAVVNITMCVAILFTFPLQIFPVFEILEGFLFGDGKICGPATHELDIKETDLLLPSAKDTGHPVTRAISPLVPAWKRNALRIGLVLLSAGVAAVCRDYFAYLVAFAGAVGSAMLAYILPCAFHISLKKESLSSAIVFKDVFIIIIGTVGGCMSVISIILEVTGILKVAGSG